MATTPVQRAPRENFAMPRGEFAAPTTAPGAPNFGTGVQPTRSPVARAMPGRNLGTMTSADLSRFPTGNPLGQKPSLTGPAFSPQQGGYAEYTPPPLAPATGLARAPSVVAAQPAYRPPQQTERANPLTGDNNFPMEGQTTAPLARAPFVQRGAGLPAGMDAAPAAIKDTLTEDNDIGTAINGTLGRIGGTGAFARKFGSAQSADVYSSYLRRLYPTGA